MQHHYEKPNMILPISLHDTRISRIETENDCIIFIFQDGFYVIDSDTVRLSGKAEIAFPRVDLDFCSVYCTGSDNYRKRYDIQDFVVLMKEHEAIIEIIDETYGYNQAKFSCSLIISEVLHDCEIEIYHFGQMKYVWED